MANDESTWRSTRGFLPSAPQPRDRVQGLVGLVWLLILLNVASVGTAGYLFYRGYGDPGLAVAPTVTPRGELSDVEKSTIELYRNLRNSVVHITTLSERRDPSSLRVERVPEGTGSGFIWDKKGHVVTNAHVVLRVDKERGLIAPAASIDVTLADQSTWPATLVGSFPDKDLAVLHIDAPPNKLLPIPVGSSDKLEVGQAVYAIGNPFGLDQTLTTGIISALGREIESVTDQPIKDVIQTDAAINPGNSGGPLLDSHGRLIGVNAAILSRSGSFAGIGFAIPVDEVRRVVPLLIEKGKISRAGLGIVPAPDQIVRRLQELDKLQQSGVLIAEVRPDSPAEKAGLKPTYVDKGQIVLGDLIVKIDDTPITKVSDLLGALEKHKAGAKVKVGLLRDGQEVDLEIQLYDLK